MSPTKTKYPELTMDGITYTLEPEGKDILCLVKDEALIDGVHLFNKIIKNGFTDLCDIIIKAELSRGWIGKEQESKLRAKEQLEWYVGLNWADAENLEE